MTVQDLGTKSQLKKEEREKKEKEMKRNMARVYRKWWEQEAIRK